MSSRILVATGVLALLLLCACGGTPEGYETPTPLTSPAILSSNGASMNVRIVKEFDRIQLFIIADKSRGNTCYTVQSIGGYGALATSCIQGDYPVDLTQDSTMLTVEVAPNFARDAMYVVIDFSRKVTCYVVQYTGGYGAISVSCMKMNN